MMPAISMPIFRVYLAGRSACQYVCIKMLREIRPIRTLMLAVLFAAQFHELHAEEAGCIDETEYQKAKATYTDVFAKYDLPTVAQEFLEAVSSTEDFKDQVSVCQKNLDESEQNRCDPLVKQYNDKKIERDALKNRFSVALQMQEYLLTLKLKLERPHCVR
jgi:hypothetical protein